MTAILFLTSLDDFKIISFFLLFSNLLWHISKSEIPFIYPSWYLLGFLSLWIISFNYFWKFHIHYLFIYFPPFSFSFPSKYPLKYMLKLLTHYVLYVSYIIYCFISAFLPLYFILDIFFWSILQLTNSLFSCI